MAPARPGSRALAGDAETRGPPRVVGFLRFQAGLGLPADQAQSIDQSQNATNSIDQTATAQSAAVNVSPNVAIANKGSVDQSSDASASAVAANKNESEQSNDLSNSAGQSQSGALADDNKSHCCTSTSEKQAPQSQSVDQTQNASNSISQNAEARSIAVNASPNVAVLNFGPVDQSSDASSKAVAVNDNRSSQSNTLDQSAEQKQYGSKKRGHCCGNPRRDRCSPCKNDCNDCRPERGCDH